MRAEESRGGAQWRKTIFIMFGCSKCESGCPDGPKSGGLTRKVPGAPYRAPIDMRASLARTPAARSPHSDMSVDRSESVYMARAGTAAFPAAAARDAAVCRPYRIAPPLRLSLHPALSPRSAKNATPSRTASSKSSTETFLYPSSDMIFRASVFESCGQPSSTARISQLFDASSPSKSQSSCFTFMRMKSCPFLWPAFVWMRFCSPYIAKMHARWKPPTVFIFSFDLPHQLG